MKKKKLLPIGIAACIAVGSFSLPSAFSCEYAVASVNDVLDFNDLVFNKVLKSVYKCIGIPFYTSPFDQYHISKANSSFVAALAALHFLEFNGKDDQKKDKPASDGVSGFSGGDSVASASDDRQGASENLPGGTVSGSYDNENVLVWADTAPYDTVTYFDVYYPAAAGTAASDNLRVPLKNQKISNNKTAPLSDVIAEAEKTGKNDGKSGVVPKEDKPSVDNIPKDIDKPVVEDPEEPKVPEEPKEPEEDNGIVTPSLPEEKPPVVTPEQPKTPELLKSYFVEVYDNSRSIDYVDSEGNEVCSVFIQGTLDTFDEEGALISSEGGDRKGTVEIKDHLNDETLTFSPGEIDNYDAFVSDRFGSDVYIGTISKGSSYPKYIEIYGTTISGVFVDVINDRSVCSIIKHGVEERYEGGELVSREGEDTEGTIEIKNLLTGEVFTFPDGGDPEDYYGFVESMFGDGVYRLEVVGHYAYAEPEDIYQNFEEYRYRDSDDEGHPLCNVNILGTTEYYENGILTYIDDDKKGAVKIYNFDTNEEFSFAPGELSDHRSFVKEMFGGKARLYDSTTWEKQLKPVKDAENPDDYQNEYYYIDSEENLVCYVSKHLYTEAHGEGYSYNDDSNAGAIKIYNFLTGQSFSFKPGELGDFHNYVLNMFNGDAYLTTTDRYNDEVIYQNFDSLSYYNNNDEMICSVVIYGTTEHYEDDVLAYVDNSKNGAAKITNHITEEKFSFAPGELSDYGSFVREMFGGDAHLGYSTSWFYQLEQLFGTDNVDDIKNEYYYIDSDDNLVCYVSKHLYTLVKEEDGYSADYSNAGLIEIYNVLTGERFSFDSGIDDSDRFVYEMFNGEAYLAHIEEYNSETLLDEYQNHTVYEYVDADGNHVCAVYVYGTKEYSKDGEIVSYEYDNVGVVDICDFVKDQNFTFEPGYFEKADDFDEFVRNMFDEEVYLSGIYVHDSDGNMYGDDLGYLDNEGTSYEDDSGYLDNEDTSYEDDDEDEKD